MEAKVVGIRETENPDTKQISTNLYLEGISFSDWESQNALLCLGSKTTSEYYRGTVDCKPGDIVELVYEKDFRIKLFLARYLLLSGRTLLRTSNKSYN